MQLVRLCLIARNGQPDTGIAAAVVECYALHVGQLLEKGLPSKAEFRGKRSIMKIIFCFDYSLTNWQEPGGVFCI